MIWHVNDQNPFNSNIRRPKRLLSKAQRQGQRKKNGRKTKRSKFPGRRNNRKGRTEGAERHPTLSSTHLQIPVVSALCPVPCPPWLRGHPHLGGPSVFLPSAAGIQLLTVTKKGKLSNSQLTMSRWHIIYNEQAVPCCLAWDIFGLRQSLSKKALGTQLGADKIVKATIFLSSLG